MLRATFTKIKRACVIALVPRLVRGDGRYTTRKFGKTSINVLRKAGKSTDSGSKDGDSDCDKCRRLIEFVFGPSKPKTNTHIYKGENKTAISNIQELHKEDVVQTQAKSETNTEKQNSLLKEFFGADEDVVRHDNFNKSFKLQTTTIDKNKLTPNNDNLDDVTSNTRRSIDMSQDERGRDYDHYGSKRCSKTGKDFKNEFTVDYEHRRSNPNEADIQDCIPGKIYKLHATTAKENEEKLIQKIEVLDEPSNVETSPSKEEGFNMPPKVLGDQFANFCNNTNTKSKSEFQESLDEIAKKCMDTPASQIDNKVMQEIEKLGIQQKDEQKSSTDEDVVQMDRLRKPEKPIHEVEIDLDNRENKREPVNCADDDKLGPSFEMPPHLDQSRVSIEDETEPGYYNKMQMTQEPDTVVEKTEKSDSTLTVHTSNQNNVDLLDLRPHYDINQPIIDPYDKKTLAFDHDELDEAVMESKLLDDQRIGKPSQNEESEDQGFAQSYMASCEHSPSKNDSRVAEDPTHLDHVQSVYDCAPREINWRPYPSFEAREEVLDFCSQQDVEIECTQLNDSETIYHMPSALEPATEESYEPQPDHIYTSTSVPSESREQISHSFVQPEEMINPLMDKNVNEPKAVEEQSRNFESNLSESFETLPSLNPDGNVSLSELLRRVRMRNRMEYCREYAIHTLNVHAPEALPVEGKCGKKTPPCPPPPPKCPPPNPCPPRPPACPPPPPPCPKPCKPANKRPCPPPKKNPCKFKKFTGTSVREVLTLLAQENPQVKIPQKYILPILAYNAIRTHGPSKNEEEEILKENLVFRLSVLGKILLFHCTEAIDAILPRNRSELSFARDYEPWTPIPSWPIPKKEEKKRFVCPKEGCKVFPPPKLNAPCKENPCLNFPKRSNFSLTDLFSFSLVESLVCHTA